MGCCGSRSLSERYAAHSATFELLALSDSDVRVLSSAFDSIVTPGADSISLPDFYRALSLDRSSFADRAFSVMDEDLSGRIDFREFVVAVWNYCTCDRASLTQFAFDLYDRDSSGSVDMDEMRTIVEEVYGSAFASNASALKLIDRLEELRVRSPEITVAGFHHFLKTHPALLFPAFNLQLQLQTAVGGQRFWARITRRRYGDGSTRGWHELSRALGRLDAAAQATAFSSAAASALEADLPSLQAARDGVILGGVAKRRRASGIDVSRLEASHERVKAGRLAADRKMKLQERRKLRRTSSILRSAARSPAAGKAHRPRDGTRRRHSAAVARPRISISDSRAAGSAASAAAAGGIASASMASSRRRPSLSSHGSPARSAGRRLDRRHSLAAGQSSSWHGKRRRRRSRGDALEPPVEAAAAGEAVRRHSGGRRSSLAKMAALAALEAELDDRPKTTRVSGARADRLAMDAAVRSAAAERRKSVTLSPHRARRRHSVAGPRAAGGGAASGDTLSLPRSPTRRRGSRRGSAIVAPMPL